jgi:hypothetical protein
MNLVAVEAQTGRPKLHEVVWRVIDNLAIKTRPYVHHRCKTDA